MTFLSKHEDCGKEERLVWIDNLDFNMEVCFLVKVDFPVSTKDFPL